MGRLLDEQMVLARLHKYFANGFAEDRWWNSTHVLTAINETPTAEQQIIRCKDCTYGEQDDIGRWYCRSLGCQIGNEDGTGFCADAERRQDG